MVIGGYRKAGRAGGRISRNRRISYPSWDEIRKGHRIAGRDIPMLAEDMPSFMSLPIAHAKAGIRGVHAVIIGAVYVHYDMDVLGGAGPAPGDILGDLAEPIGMTDYEVIRCALEIGKRGFTGASFICIPPGSAVVYPTITYVIMFMLAGMALTSAGRA